MADNKLYKIGITHGDLNGIGYEVIIKSLIDNKMMEICTPIVYGLSKVATFHRKMLEIQDFSFQFIKNVDQASLKKPNLINLYDEEVKVDIGTSTKTAGQMAERALYAAGRDLKNKNIDAIVTAPVNKENIQSDKYVFPGQTEFFEHYFGGTANPAIMMMVHENLRIGFVTNHEPLEKVNNLITKDLIYKKLKILNQSLKQDFKIANPTIAVLALNPHASDNNVIGTEEKEQISPAIELAFQDRINAFGPFPADNFFSTRQYRKFDAVLAMYHDQGMIPFKLITDEGVNFTAGLPIVHTAPTHGTAYDIAGKNVADGQSMRNAIYLAIDILRNRQNG